MISASIGLPRSGKSTFCRDWKKWDYNRVVLSGDDFRYAITNQRFELCAELHVRANLMAAVRALHRAGYHVFVDETNTSIAHIKEILDIDHNANFYIFYTDKQTCKNRAIDCNQQDLIPSIDRMYENLMVTLPLIYSGGMMLSYQDIGNRYAECC